MVGLFKFIYWILAILALVVTVAAWITLLVKRNELETFCTDAVKEAQENGTNIAGLDSTDACANGLKGLLIGGGFAVIIGNMISVSPSNQKKRSKWLIYKLHNIDLFRLHRYCIRITLEAKLPASSFAWPWRLPTNIIQDVCVLNIFSKVQVFAYFVSPICTFVSKYYTIHFSVLYDIFSALSYKNSDFLFLGYRDTSSTVQGLVPILYDVKRIKWR